MKFTANSLLLLVLSGTLVAQSQIAQPKPSAFPSQITHVIVIFQENRTPDSPLFEPAVHHSKRGQRLKRVHPQSGDIELL